MKRFSHITSVETKAELEEALVERFVQENLPPKFDRRSKFSGMGDFADANKEVECCAAELPINGTIQIFFTSKGVQTVRRISHPVMARFIAFCTREGNTDFKVAWSSSLS